MTSKYFHQGLFTFLIFSVIQSCTPPSPELLDIGIPLEMSEFRKQQVGDVVYELSFEIPEVREEPIPSQLKLSLTINDLSQPLYLDFNENADHLQKVIVNDKPVEIDHRLEHLIIPSSELVIGENSVLIDFIAGELSLNRNEDFLYTLLVPDRASTLFPCFDQPDIKANYVLNITAPKNWKVMCGAPEIEQLEKEESTLHRFGMTEKMSTYLFSFVAGRFESSKQNPGEFDMEFIYRETNEEKLVASTDELFKLHQQSIDFLKDYTDSEFPFQKLDFALIPGFQYGGMEHVGAIQYRESSLMLDNSATESRKLGRGKLIAHETSHMWFGDLVTMKWFSDVWMKEVFANFMADKIVNPAFPEINHDLQFMVNHYPSAYGEDRTKGTNPIRQKLDNLKNAGSLYGGIIYNKAPIMMRQLEAVLGKEAFQEGIQEYIATYSNGNADWNELVEIFDQKTTEDMRRWSEVWVNQSGRPILTDEISYNDSNQISSFRIQQIAEDGSEKIWPQSFDIDFLYADSVHTIAVNLTGNQVMVESAVGLERPDAITYNSNGFGYGIFPIKEDDLNLIPELADDVARGYSYINTYENTLNGSLSPLQSFELFQKGLTTETNELIMRLLSNQTRSIYWKYLSNEERDTYQQPLENLVFEQLQRDLGPNLKKTLYRLFSSMAYSDNGKERLYQIWNKELVIENLKLNEDDYTSLAMNLAVYQHADASEILIQARKAIRNPDKLSRFDFLQPSLSNDENTRDEFFKSLRDATNREKESWVLAAVGYIHHPLRAESAVKHLEMSLEILEEIQKTGDIFFPKRWLSTTIGRHSSEEAFEIVEDFLATRPDFSPVLKNKLLQATDDLDRVHWMRSK